VSDDLYATRLRWSRGSGLAMLHRRSVPLTEAPVLCGGQVHELDYTPEVRACRIRRAPHDAMGDMTNLEIAAADALLRELVDPKESPCR